MVVVYLDYSVSSGPFLRFSMRFEFLSEILYYSVCEICEIRDPSLTISNVWWVYFGLLCQLWSLFEIPYEFWVSLWDVWPFSQWEQGPELDNITFLMENILYYRYCLYLVKFSVLSRWNMNCSLKNLEQYLFKLRRIKSNELQFYESWAIKREY